MAEARTGSRVGFFGLLLAGLVLLAGGSGGRADDKKAAKADETLRAELLKLNTVTGEDAQLARARALVKDKAKGKAAVAEAAAMIREAKKDPPLNLTASALLGRVAVALRDYDAAEALYNFAAEEAARRSNGAKMREAYLGLVAAHMGAKRYAAVVDVCEKVLEMKDAPTEVENASFQFLDRMIRAKALAGQTDEALKAVEGLAQLPNDGWLFYELKAWVQHQGGKTEAAIKTYNDLMTKVDKVKGLKAEEKEDVKDDARHALSNLYIETGEGDKAIQQLEELLKRHPDNATYKNDLGFVWADMNTKLDDAEKLIREALEIDRKAQEKLKADGTLDEVKDNAAYVDSLGWVMFRRGKYDEALKYLRQATADEEGNHLEIWDHLADCYAAMGQKKEAVATWEKALKLEDVSKRDSERRRKVTEKLKKTRAELKP